MIEVMNAMDFDLATFGNHEFDIKENELILPTRVFNQYYLGTPRQGVEEYFFICQLDVAM